MRRAAGRVADEIDEERQVPAVMAGRHIDVDPASGWIAKQVVFEAIALDPETVHRAGRHVMVLAHRDPS
jgi:hypothetical protein